MSPRLMSLLTSELDPLCGRVDLAVERGHKALARRLLSANAIASAAPLRSDVQAARAAGSGGQGKSRKKKSPEKRVWSGFGPVNGAEVRGANGKRI